MQSRHNVFAYGSNLNPVQMQQRCPSARFVSPARLPGHRLAFNRYSGAWEGGVADVVPDRDCEVWGIVWSIREEDLAILDRFEVVPQGYVRSLLKVRSATNDVVSAWTYQVATKASHIPPTERYLEIMIRACREHRFPESHRHAIEAAARGLEWPRRQMPSRGEHDARG